MFDIFHDEWLFSVLQLPYLRLEGYFCQTMDLEATVRIHNYKYSLNIERLKYLKLYFIFN